MVKKISSRRTVLKALGAVGVLGAGSTGLSLAAGDEDSDNSSDDGDDQRENASEIESGQEVVGTLTGRYDQDWYTISVDQDESVAIDWSLTSPEDAILNYDYELRTPSGDSIKHAEMYEGDPGQYYLFIRPNDADTAPSPEEHRYEFTVTLESENGQEDTNQDDGSDSDVDVDDDEC